MPEDPKPPLSPKRKRGIWRRVLRWAAALLLVAAIFHRPLFHHGVRFALVRAAAFQHLRLDLRLSGNIFTNLAIDGVRVEPTGGGSTPVRRIAIEHLRFDYSFPSLVKHGLGEFLRSYAVRNAELELVALPSKSKREKKQKRAIAEQLNTILAQPAAYADRVNIANFNVTVTAPTNVTRVLGFHLLLDPEKIGHLRIARLEIPGVPVWENLQAATSYEGRNLFIKDLQLAPELIVEELNFDASRRAQNTGGIWLKLRAFGGTAQLSLTGSELAKKGENLAKSYNTQLTVNVENVELPAAAKYFGAPPPPVDRLGRLALDFVGEPERPRTWRGTMALRVGGLAAGQALTVDAVALDATFRDGRAFLAPLQASAGKNTATINAEVALPESVNDFPKSELDATLKLDAPDLPAVTRALPKPLTGKLSGDGTIKLRNRQLDLVLALDASEIAGDDLALASGRVTLRASKRLDDPAAKPFTQLDGKLTAALSALRFKTFAIDATALDAELREQVVTVRRFEVRRGDNSLSAQGDYRVPDHPKDAARMPADVQFTVQAPKLQDFGIGAKETVLSGRLDGRGAVKLIDGVPAGDIQLDGGEFAFGEFKAEKLAAKIRFADRAASIEELALQINATDRIAVGGKAGLEPPFAYDGTLLVAVKDLAAFQPLLAVFGVKAELAGALDIDWTGHGEVRAGAPPAVPVGTQPAPNHQGKLAVNVAKARYGKIDLSEFRLAGQYRPTSAETTLFRVQSGPTALTASIEWAENRLRVKDLELTQAGATALTGFVLLPFDPGAKPPLPTGGRVAANLNAKDLDLEKLLGSFGQTSPVGGVLTANFVTGGTLLRPVGHLKLEGRKLKAKAVPQLDPADLNIAVHYADKALALDADLRQPQIQPLTVKGRVPLDLEAMIQQRKLDPNLPLDVTVKLPPSSLALITKLSPAVRRIEGTAAIEVHAGGTVGKPELSGETVVKVQSARLLDENVPAIGRADVHLTFAGDTLRLAAFRGEIGGGTFSATGSIQFPKITEPIFDLNLKTDEVLAKRDDSVTIRLDTDIRVTGPLAAGEVRGDLIVTHSRFFRDIDILPIGLPGRPQPKPRAPPSAKTVSIDKPPLRDWKFDIHIKTRPDDPFRIRGNLANGHAAIDLKLGGNGFQPWLEGNVRVEDFVATLPFSKLTITRGFVHFSQSDPFQAKLDLQAESTLRTYQVNAYIFGAVNDPQVTLTSEPPLAQAEIIALLATGSTTEELTGKPDVLAGRAAVLLFQQVYRKVFKKKEPSEEESLLDRMDLDVGAVDSRTGRQELSAGFKLGEQFYLIGELDVTGNFTGRVRYLLRFR